LIDDHIVDKEISRVGLKFDINKVIGRIKLWADVTNTADCAQIWKI
jgi:hypothetical protein